MKADYVGESYAVNRRQERVRHGRLLSPILGSLLVTAALFPSAAHAPEHTTKFMRAARPATIAVKAAIVTPKPTIAPKSSPSPEIATAPPMPTATPEQQPKANTAKSAKKQCTRLRRRPNEVMYGYLCSDKAKSAVIDSGYGDGDWVYSAVVTDGIYKCGYVRQNVLPSFEPSKDVVSRCRDYYIPLTRDRYSTLSNFNCPELLPGVEGCRDGTKGAQPFSANNNLVTLYGNYATDEPSPLNLYGTGDGGFSDPFKIPTALLRYRAQVKLGSEDGYAAVVRGDDNWGLVSIMEVDPEKMTGGTPSLLSPNQLNRVFSDPTSTTAYQELTAR